MTQPSPVPGPRPGPLAASEGSGEVPDGVAQALARLEELESTPVSDHVQVFDDVHRLLQDTLATLDEA